MSPAELLLNASFEITINTNDFFIPASAHAVVIDSSEYKWVLEIVKKYGNDGLNACLSHIQKLLPLQNYCTPKFYEALNEIKNLKNDGSRII